MTWMGEVAHVAWKDLRQQRWLVLAYVALVVVATWRAVLLAHANSTPAVFIAVMPLVVILGCFLSAIVMQTDSPARADAFWVTRPFHGSAVLAAKMLVIGTIVVGVALVGEAIGLSAFDVSLSHISWMLFACFTTFGLWLLLSMLIGAATRDLRSSIVGSIAVVIATGLTAGLLTKFAPSLLREWVRPLLYMVSILGAVITLVTLYVRRGRALHVWPVAGLTTACAFMTAVAPPSEAPPRFTSQSAGPLQLRVNEPRGVIQSGRLGLTVSAPDAPDSLSTKFRLSRVAVHLRDGSIVQLERGFAALELRTIDVPVAAGTRWLSRGSFFRRSNGGFDVELTGREMSLLSHGISEVEVTGFVSLERPRALGTLPLTTGAEIRSAGRETHVMSVNETTRGFLLDLASIGLETDGESARNGAFIGSERISFALVNDRLGEALPLVSNGAGSSSDWLILPGTSLTNSTFRLQSFLRSTSSDSLSLTPEWYHDARLIVATWETANSYPVTVRAKLD